jgi:hypothetical protein
MQFADIKLGYEQAVLTNAAMTPVQVIAVTGVDRGSGKTSIEHGRASHPAAGYRSWRVEYL